MSQDQGGTDLYEVLEWTLPGWFSLVKGPWEPRECHTGYGFDSSQERFEEEPTVNAPWECLVHPPPVHLYLSTPYPAPLQRRDSKDSSRIQEGLPVALPARNDCS